MTTFEALVSPGLPPHLGDPDRRPSTWITLKAQSVDEAQTKLDLHLYERKVYNYSFTLYHEFGDEPITRLTVFGWDEEDA